MAGNTFGEIFRVTTCGESHGSALLAIVDGCPPGMTLSIADIQPYLDRRRPGQSHYTTQRREADQVQLLSGVFEGRTTGTPIGLFIRNQDAKSKDYAAIRESFRPGHADFSYFHKYGIRDHRGGGRASARETAMRVAAGAIARKYLNEFYGCTILAHVVQIGSIQAQQFDPEEILRNDFFSADAAVVADFAAQIKHLRKAGDSCGARVRAVVDGVPSGWGEPVFSRLDADIAAAMMGINAAKAVAIGDGFDVVAQRGSEHRDIITPQGFASNHAGGILGGISSGQQIIVDVAFKPASSIRIPASTIDVHGQPTEITTLGRHDPCVGIRAVPIVEAMLALVLMDHALRQRAQCGNCGKGV